jgi:2-methylisocitrate lyase-like PEP mutase family enzyme
LNSGDVVATLGDSAAPIDIRRWVSRRSRVFRGKRTRRTRMTEKAAGLRALHVSGDPLVLANAWDGASARMAVAAPVTVDFERGYGLAPTELVEAIAATGAVGLNLEDSDPASGAMVEVAEQAEYLTAVRAAAQAAGVDLVINARTDSFLRSAGSPEEQLAASVDRGDRYLAAGADCVYPIAVVDPDVIRALVGGIPGPINVVYGRGALTLAGLADLGFARVSFGPALQRFVYGKFGSALSALASDANPMAL